MVTRRLDEEFVATAGAAGGEVERFSDLAEALAFVSCLLKQLDIKNIAVSPDVLVPSAEISRWPLLKPKKTEDYLSAEAGLVEADYGISYTGTLVHLDRNDTEKMVWTLPRLCLCLLDERRIVQNLGVIAEVLSRHLSSMTLGSPQVSLVTGPSRTADIECQLSLGVHGPCRLIILLFKGGASGSDEKN
jgi:L-lactate dehydrogenase complex protein LldG